MFHSVFFKETIGEPIQRNISRACSSAIAAFQEKTFAFTDRFLSAIALKSTLQKHPENLEDPRRHGRSHRAVVIVVLTCSTEYQASSISNLLLWIIHQARRGTWSAFSAGQPARTEKAHRGYPSDISKLDRFGKWLGRPRSCLYLKGRGRVV